MKISKFMRAVRLTACLGGAMLLHFTILSAQNPEASDPAQPLDDITGREVIADRSVLAYQPIREADILWEKRIWRVIDTREKMNLPFVAPESSLFQILENAIMEGDLNVYSTEDDKFSKRLSPEDVRKMMYKRDTIITIDPVTYEETVKVVENQIDWQDVKRFRLKEAWFFDTKTSTLRNRILGIAPVIDARDSEGNFKFEQPMF